MIVITQPIVELASRQRELAAGREPPPVGKWNPAHCGEIDIRIARDGTWFHDGSPIARRELVRLLSTILRREPDGHYYLVTPAEKMRIAVEDAPFLVVLPDVCGSGRDQQLAFITNVGDETIADSENRIRVNLRANEEPAPYVHMRRGLEPCISRNVFYQLAQLAVAGEDASVGGLGVWSSGVFFPLGSVA